MPIRKKTTGTGITPEKKIEISGPFGKEERAVTDKWFGAILYVRGSSWWALGAAVSGCARRSGTL